MSGEIEIRELSWPLAGDAVLRGVDLAIGAGERVAILGPSGSGKSSLLRCIVGLEACAGTIAVHGETLGPTTVLDVRRRVVLVPQTPSPVGATVAENLEFAERLGGLSTEQQRGLMAACDMADVPGDRAFGRLSVGERQRLCFVRAMTLQPDVLLLDEPTASLDAANVATIERLVASWQTEDAARAVVWVTHDETQATRVADRVLRLHEGRIEAA